TCAENCFAFASPSARLPPPAIAAALLLATDNSSARRRVFFEQPAQGLCRVQPSHLVDSLGERQRMSAQHLYVVRIGLSFFQYLYASVDSRQIQLKSIDTDVMIFGPRDLPCSLCTHFFLFSPNAVTQS